MRYVLKIKNPDTNRFATAQTFKTRAAAQKSINKYLKGLPKKYIKVQVMGKRKK